MRGIRLTIAVLLAAACGKPAGGGAAGWTLADYAAPAGAYRCRAPERWKVKEEAGGDAMFFGPDRVSIGVGRYAGDGRVKTPQDYARSLRGASPLEKTAIGGKTVYRLHRTVAVRAHNSEKVLYEKREDAALIPAGKGFFAIEHRAPAGSYQATLPVFEAMVASFQPNG